MKIQVKFGEGDGPRPSNAEIRRAWGDWLDGFEWSHWGTLTTRWPASRDKLLNLWRAFVASVEAKFGGGVSWVVFYEVGGGGLGHMHFVMHFPENAPGARALGKFWKHGRTDVRPFDPTQPGVYYISKWAGRIEDNFELSATFPPPRPPRPTDAIPTAIRPQASPQGNTRTLDPSSG